MQKKLLPDAPQGFRGCFSPNFQGNFGLGVFSHSENILALALDPVSSLLWVATAKTIEVLDDSGQVVGTLDLGDNPKVSDLDVDPPSGDLWVALSDSLLRYDPVSDSSYEKAIQGIETVAATVDSGVWAATKKHLLKLDQLGETLAETEPFDQTIVAVVSDPRDLSAWAARQKHLNHIGADGQMLHELELHSLSPVLNLTGRIWGLALYADVIAPEISIIAPADGSLINTNTPEIRILYSDIGIGVDPNSLVLTVNGQPLAASCNFDLEGATCTPSSPLPEGEIILTAEIQDFVGNLSNTAQVTFTVDTIAPSLSITAPDQDANLSTNQPTVQLSYSDSGSGIDTDTLTLQLNGSELPVTCSSDTSTSSCVPDSSLEDGPATVVATIQDLAGNTSAPAQVGFLVDTVAPTLTITAPEEGSLHNTATPQIQLSYSDDGSGPDTSSLQLLANGNPLPVNCTTDTSQATCSPVSSFSDGPVALSATISDLAGNPSETAQVSFDVDTTAPELSFTAPQEDSILDTNTPSITLIYSDEGSGVDTASLVIQANGVDLPSNCTFDAGSASCTPATPLDEGSISLSAVIADQAGNTSPPAQVSFVVDTIAPTLGITSPSEGSAINTSGPEIALSHADDGSGVDFSTLILTANGNPLDVNCTFNGAGTCTATAPLPEGTIILVATIQDLAGNGSQPAQVTFTVDLTPPEITVTSPGDGSIVADPQQNLIGQVNEPATLTINGAPVSVAESDAFDHGPVTLNPGLNIFDFEAVDPAGNTGTLTIQVTLNRPPFITSTPVTEVHSSATYDYLVQATDPDPGALLTFSVVGPAGMTMDSATGQLSWTPSALDVGDHAVTVRVEDQSALFDTQSFTVSVLNSPPAIVSSPEINATAGEPYTYDADANDPDPGDVLTFSLDAGPSGMTVAATTGLIQWTPDNCQGGEHTITVRVEDLAGLFDTQTYTLTVERVCVEPPANLIGWWQGQGHTFDIQNRNDGELLNGATYAAGKVGQGFSLDGVDDTVRIPDPDGAKDLDGFSELTIDAWVRTTAEVGAQAIVSKYDSRISNGISYHLTIRRQDDIPGRLQIRVSNAPNGASLVSREQVVPTGILTHVAGVWKGGSDFELYVNGERLVEADVELSISGSESSTMASNSVPVNIGRFESSSGTTTEPFGHFSGLIDEVEIFDRALIGSEIRDIYCAGSVGKCVPDNLSPRFTSTPPTAATQDQLYSYDAQASDPDAGDVLTFSLQESPAGMNVDSATGRVEWTPSADQTGDHTVTLRVEDQGGLFDTQDFAVAVADVQDAPSITSAPVTSGTEGQLYSYDVEATDPDVGDTLTYSLEVSPAGMGIDATTGLIQWTPDASQIGGHQVTVRVEDNTGLFDTQSFTLVVTEINDPPSIISTPAVLAIPSQLYTYDVQATDPDSGDVLTYSLEVSPAGMGIDPATGLIQWTPTGSQGGDHGITVKVEDTAGLSDTQSFILTVPTNAPTIVSSPVSNATAGETYLYDVDATDSDANDVLRFSLPTAPDEMDIDPITGLIQWTPDNCQGGEYTVIVRVEDAAGLFDTQTYTLTVERVCVPAPGNLFNWYPGEGDGTDVWSGKDGVLQGGAGFAPGQVGQAFSLDGTSDHVLLPSSVRLNIDNDFSIDAWVKNSTQAGLDMVFGQSDGPNGSNIPLLWFYVFNGSAGAFLRGADSPDTLEASSTRLVNDGEWHHIALVWTAASNSAQIYVDGVADGSVSGPLGGNTASNDWVGIGGVDDNFRGGVQHFFEGLIDEVEIFHRALSSAEIQSIYCAGNAGKCQDSIAPPVAFDDAYNIDERTTLVVAAPGVLANDFDPNGDFLTANLISGPSHGTLDFNPDGSFTYNPGWTVNVLATNVSTLNLGVGNLAADLGTGDLYAKSIRAPDGQVVQLAHVTPGGVVTTLETYPDLSNSNRSGIAVDPLTGGIIVADTIRGGTTGDPGRIALISLSSLNVTTLFNIPWTMNPNANGTGQHQYAPDPNNPNILYFWDSTVAKLFRLDRSTDTLSELLALDQGTPDGEHFSTNGNNITLDPSTGTLLLADRSSESVLEVDPSTSPVTVTPLFSGVPTFLGIGLNPATNEIFVTTGFTILVGPRSGGSLSSVASGFDFISDLTVGKATSGDGFSLFAAERDADTIHEIIAFAGEDSFTYDASDGIFDSNEATVTITVNRLDLTAPAVRITSPQNGDTFPENTPIRFTATATDPEDGDITPSLTWRSDLDGQDFGTGGDFTFVLPPGTHAISATATDSNGDIGRGFVTVTVEASEVTVPDVVGQRQADAETDLVRVNLTVGTVSEENSDTVPAGTVISQTPTAGSVVEPGSAVDLVVSLGPAGSPVITSAPGTTGAPGQAYSYDVEANDPDLGTGDVLNFSLPTSPDGMGIDLATGLIQWTPDASQVGDSNVTVRVEDTSGLFDTQSFTVTVIGSPPDITSTEITTGTQGELYTYDVEATDPDPGDVLTFSLERSPRGMDINGSTGLIEWTPDSAQSGVHQVILRVEDLAGLLDQQGFIVRVENVNDPPEFISTPPTNAVQDQPYAYNIQVTDPDPGDTLNVTLETNPAGMILAPGQLTWTPTASQVGDHLVTLRVEDQGGLFDTQTFTISVANVNDAPSITSSPVTAALQDETYNYDVDATDPDVGDTLTFSLYVAPTGMSVDPTSGLIGWTPDASQTGTNAVTVRVQDLAGLFDTQSFTVTVEPRSVVPGVEGLSQADAEAVILTAGLTVGTITQSNSATVPAGDVISQSPVTGTAVAVGSSVDLEVSIGPVIVTVPDVVNVIQSDAEAVIVATGLMVGAITTRHSAVPEGGVISQEPVAGSQVEEGSAVNLEVSLGPIPGDTTAPVVSISSPGEDAELISPTDVVGTVDDENLLRYELTLSRISENGSRVVGSGSASVIDDVLGQVDTTLLENGMYRVRLFAEDLNGQTASIQTAVRVGGQMKLGIVRLSFVDVDLPVVGIPITLIRTYDSRVKTKRDFGIGWSLHFATGTYENNRTPGEGWQITTGPPPFGLPCQVISETLSHLTEIRLSQRESYLFRTTLSDTATTVGGCFATAGFEFVDGTLLGATLHPLRESRVLFQNGSNRVLDSNSLLSYDPEQVRLTIPDGRIVDFDQEAGIIRLQDLNGNSLTITPDGIDHSSGRSVSLNKDPQGRIDSITDPMENSIQYEYDAQGDLVSVIDQVGQTTTFVYSQSEPHHLVKIVAPDGTEVAEFKYNNGRVTDTCDADDDCTVFTHDLEGQIETILDPTGRSTSHTYDLRGNVTSMTDALGHRTILEYDSSDNLVQLTDASGGVTQFSYDSNGNMTSRTEPHEPTELAADFTTSYTYTQLNQIDRILLPSGGELRFTYSPNGNLERLENEAGDLMLSSDYGPNGEIERQGDMFGFLSYVTNQFGEPIEMRDDEGQLSEFVWDANGQLTSMQDKEGVASFEYDGLGRLLRSDYGSGLEASYEYKLGPIWTRLSAPTIGSLERKFHPDGELAGWVRTDNSNVSFLYDAAGRLKEERGPGGSRVLYTYDGAGRLSDVRGHPKAASEGHFKTGHFQEP